MFNKSLIIAAGVLASCLIPLSSFASDSTAVIPVGGTPVNPHVKYTTTCQDTWYTKAVKSLFLPVGGTYGTQTVSCPQGYFPRAMNKWEYAWNMNYVQTNTGFQCCKTEVSYDTDNS